MRGMRRHPVVAALLVLSLLGALAIVFLPIGWALNRLIVWLYYAGRGIGMPEFVTLAWYDIALNMLLFAVPVALASILWPGVRRWVWIIAVLIASIGIETVQLLALPRDASIGDVLANTAGAALGTATAAAVSRVKQRAERRDQRAKP